MLEKRQVHMLPTEKKDFLPAGIVLATRSYDDGQGGIEEGKLYYNKNPKIPINTSPYNSFIPQHLYFTSDEEIKEGDWIFIACYNCIGQVGSIKEDMYILKSCTASLNNVIAKWAKPESRKIVATTNPELWEEEVMNWGPVIKTHKIAFDFINAYVRAQGSINEVLIECFDNLSHGKPRVREDGTVIIHKVRDRSDYTPSTIQEITKYFEDNFYIDARGRMVPKKEQIPVIIIDHMSLINTKS